MNTEFTIIVPARFASSRLPGKPLRDIAGLTMIQRVWEQAAAAGAARVIVATDDRRIADSVAHFGGEAVMTDPGHTSGTDRLQEVAAGCGLADDAIVVNVQGDEPLIPPQVIAQVAGNLARHPEAAAATLSEPLQSPEEFRNPNIVKVVTDARGLALYFSRAPIPWPRDQMAAGGNELPADFAPRRHLGIYAYRVRELDNFVGWPVAPPERLESLEQLRFLWNGARIHVAQACVPVPGGVDTEEDLQRVSARLAGTA